MSEREFAQAKQCALTTRDWDSYQIILRTCLSPDKSVEAVSRSAGITDVAGEGDGNCSQRVTDSR